MKNEETKWNGVDDLIHDVFCIVAVHRLFSQSAGPLDEFYAYNVSQSVNVSVRVCLTICKVTPHFRSVDYEITGPPTLNLPLSI